MPARALLPAAIPECNAEPMMTSLDELIDRDETVLFRAPRGRFLGVPGVTLQEPQRRLYAALSVKRSCCRMVAVTGE